MVPCLQRPAWFGAGESSHEGLVSHRSAVRGRDFRNDPDLTASDAAWCRAEGQSGTGRSRALAPSLPAGVQACLSPRLLWLSLLLISPRKGASDRGQLAPAGGGRGEVLSKTRGGPGSPRYPGAPCGCSPLLSLFGGRFTPRRRHLVEKPEDKRRVPSPSGCAARKTADGNPSPCLPLPVLQTAFARHLHPSCRAELFS